MFSPYLLDDPVTSLHTHSYPRPDSPPPTFQTHHNHRQQQIQRDAERKAHNARSPLALLATDEAAIAQRKAAIRNFGAYWIRPPGIAKTLQAMNEEELERLEQEEINRQERGLLDMQAQQQLQDAQRQAAETAEAQETGELPEDRDLDEEIPEAEDTTGEVSFNEDSVMEGSRFVEQAEHVERSDLDGEQYAEMEEAELTGAARDEEELGIEPEEVERDLDDSVPEAGSYQHTDTENEDSDSESELQNSFSAGFQSAQRSTRAARTHPQQQQQFQGLHSRFRNQMEATELPRSPGNPDLSSSLVESSFVGSSPVMQRGGLTGRGASRRGRSRQS